MRDYLVLYVLLGCVLLSCKDNTRRDNSTQGFSYIPSSKSGVTFNNNLSNSEYDNIIVNPHFYDGAGVAVGDINNDGLPDLYFVSNQWENKLYLNKGDFEFEDITKKAGVGGVIGWDFDVIMVDANKDGFVDIVVFGKEENRVFLNNKDNTFRQGESMVQITDEYDVNGDGLPDEIKLGQLPYDDKVLKTTSLRPANKILIQFGPGKYIDIAHYAGVAATDWSSDYLLADFDNDGLKDLFVANGIVGRTNDLDRLRDSTKMSTEQRYSSLPSGAVPNLFFRQQDNLKFEDVTEQWIGRQPTISTDAEYADLDNDGDFDIVVNNTNAEAFLMRNELAVHTDVKKPIKASIPATSFLEPVDRLITFKHNENLFSSFDRQPLIPHSNATRGPKMSTGDVNGDKLDDIFICGGQGQPGTVIIQTKKGQFVQIPQPAFEVDKECEETCSAFLDVDGDKDLDLLIGSGGEEFLDKRLLLRLYINNGRGTFTRAEGLKRADIVNSLQKIYVNASCIAPADVDNDGDIDVFVGGGVVTGRYGFDSDSFILTNDGKGMLTGSPTSFDSRQHPVGMIQSAVWIDIDNDTLPELITAGEWMTPTLWKNNKGVLRAQTRAGFDSLYGWWNILAKGDLDNDGDEDLVAGNSGTNIRFDVSKHPLKLYVTDLDVNGTLEPLMAFNDRPVASRDQLLKQAPFLERRFRTYASYSQATINQLVTGKVLFERQMNFAESVIFLNQGNGKFIRKSLPYEAQWFPIFAINISDVNSDGKNDILLGGNLHAVSPELNSNNDGYGLLLIGRGDGTFDPQRPSNHGFSVKGEARDIKSLITFNKEKLFLVTRNNDSLLVFKKK
ncbi:MAG: VCBS repeat-containing protein [Bacteroidota bacterium]